MMSGRSHLMLALTLGPVVLFLLVVLPVGAIDTLSIVTVINTNDSGSGSLRQAIADAGAGDTILFNNSLNGQTITLNGQLIINKNLTINGPSASLLAISGNDTSRVFNIASTVTISGVTIKDGSFISNGGGIFNSGTVTLINSTVSNNTASRGGGIFSSDGTLALTNSTVSSNTAPEGGGIWNFGVGTLVLTNSTVSSNTATLGGGGIINAGLITLTNSTFSSNTAPLGGGIFNGSGITTLINSTVSSNMASNHGGGIYNSSTISLINSTVSSNTASFSGGGIFGFGGTMIFKNTILAANQANAIANECTDISASSSLISGGYNLMQTPSTSCVLSGAGDVTSVDPLLGPLSNNGGDTFTHALLDGSPAINKIPDGSNGCGTIIITDQRGTIRPQGGACDIGAYEAVVPVDLYLPLISKN